MSVRRDLPPEERALRAAVRWLSRRALTEHELASRLAAKGFPSGTVDAVLERLRGWGALDDLRFTAQFIVGRSTERLQGRRRIFADLERRGVPPARAEAMWEQLHSEGLVDEEASLARALEREIQRRRGDRRARARVYNALLRAGFDPDRVLAALETRLPEPMDPPAGESP